MSYKYFSQFGEDYLMWEYFNRKKNGYFIEVGAFDGIHFSNTYSFELMGWRGICFEPHPDYFPLCGRNRPKSICLNLALVGEDSISEIGFYAENIGLLSGVNPDIEDIERRYRNRGLEFQQPKKIVVKASTLNRVLEENNVSSIDFITIDVEGNEIDVLNGFNISKYKPEVFIIEANDEQQEQKLLDFFKNYPDYFFARKTGVNLYFVRGKSNAKRLSKIILDWEPEKQLHPLGSDYSIQSKSSKGSKPVKSNFIKRILRKFK